MHELSRNGRALRLIRGDITEVTADAIVNAANSRLAGGGGVDGAIHRAGGPSIMEELQHYDGCPPGNAVATGAGNLQARYVFHAVGPVWQGGNKGEEETLRNAYKSCMELAEKHCVGSIAFPSLSTGVYGYPLEKAAPVALSEVWKQLNRSACVKSVEFVLFDARSRAGFETALRKLKEKGDQEAT